LKAQAWSVSFPILNHPFFFIFSKFFRVFFFVQLTKPTAQVILEVQESAYFLKAT